MCVKERITVFFHHTQTKKKNKGVIFFCTSTRVFKCETFADYLQSSVFIKSKHGDALYR